MKNALWTGVALSAMMLFACNQIDKTVVDKLQTEVTKSQELAQSLESAEKSASDLMNQINAAPDELKFSKDFNFNELQQRAELLQKKYAAMLAESKEQSTALQNISDEYTDGNKKKDEVVKTTESVGKTTEGAQAQMKEIAAMFDELSANYAKMMASWQALPEAEKAKRKVAADSLLKGTTQDMRQ